MRCLVLLSLALAGCTLSAVVEPPSEPFATIVVAHKSDGSPAARVHSFHAQGSLVTRHVDAKAQATRVYLSPGKYTVEIDCLMGYRNAQGQEVRWYVMDAADTFEFSVIAGRLYELGCAPSPDGPGFYATAGT